MTGSKCRKKPTDWKSTDLYRTRRFHQLCDVRSLTLTCDSSSVKMVSQRLPHRIMKTNVSINMKTFLLRRTNVNERYPCCHTQSTPVLLRLHRTLNLNIQNLSALRPQPINTSCQTYARCGENHLFWINLAVWHHRQSGSTTNVYWGVNMCQALFLGLYTHHTVYSSPQPTRIIPTLGMRKMGCRGSRLLSGRSQKGITGRFDGKAFKFFS